jgi:hypothetical protein
MVKTYILFSNKSLYLKGLSREIYLAEIDGSLLKGKRGGFPADFAHPLACERPLSVGAISYKIWDMIKINFQLLYIPLVATFLNPILVFPIPLTHPLESSPNGY